MGDLLNRGKHRIARRLVKLRLLHQPTRGYRCFEYATFQVNDYPDLDQSIYTLV